MTAESELCAARKEANEVETRLTAELSTHVEEICQLEKRLSSAIEVGVGRRSEVESLENDLEKRQAMLSASNTRIEELEEAQGKLQAKVTIYCVCVRRAVLGVHILSEFANLFMLFCNYRINWKCAC